MRSFCSKIKGDEHWNSLVGWLWTHLTRAAKFSNDQKLIIKAERTTQHRQFESIAKQPSKKVIWEKYFPIMKLYKRSTFQRNLPKTRLHSSWSEKNN